MSIFEHLFIFNRNNQHIKKEISKRTLSALAKTSVHVTILTNKGQAGDESVCSTFRSTWKHRLNILVRWVNPTTVYRCLPASVHIFSHSVLKFSKDERDKAEYSRHINLYHQPVLFLHIYCSYWAHVDQYSKNFLSLLLLRSHGGALWKICFAFS